MERLRAVSTAPKRRGATALELVVSTGILVGVLYFAGLLGSTGRAAFLGASRKTDDGLRAHRALDRVVSELALAARDTLFPVPDAQFGASEVTFQQVVDIVGNAPVLGPLTRLRLECADGLVDECRLLLTRDLGGAEEQTLVLCRDVAELLAGEEPNGADDNGNGLVDEPGFCLALEGDVLSIRLTLANPDATGASTLRTVETSLEMRN